MNGKILSNRNDKFIILGLMVMAVFLSLISGFINTSLSWLVLSFVVVLSIFIIRPEIGLYMLALFLPVINWNFYYQSLEMPFIDILSIVLAAAFALRFIFQIFHDPKAAMEIKFPFLLSFILFFTSVLASSYFDNEMLKSLWYAVRWILLSYLCYLFIPVNVIKNENILKTALGFFILSAILVSTIGLLSMPGQDWRSEFIRIQPVSIAGIYPIGSNQNLIVETILPALFFILFFRTRTTQKRTKRILDVLFVFLLLVLIGTFSRGGWLSFIVSFSLFLLFTYRDKVRKFIIPGIVLLTLCTPVFYYMYLMQTDFNIGGGSNASRIVSTEIAWRAFMDKPWFGQGTGEYINLIDDDIRFKARFGDPLDSHGVFQKVMAENGIFGLVTFFIFLGSIIIYIFRAIKKYPEYFNSLLPVALGAFSIVFFEFFNTSYYKGKMWLPIALIIAAIYLVKEKKLSYDKQ